MSELELIELCQQGRNDARKKLYETYSEQMMSLCYRYTGNKMEAQDLLHDGFIKVFATIQSFQYQGDNSLKAWMKKVFTNTALEYLRKNTKERFSSTIEDWQEELAEMPEEEEFRSISNDVLMRFISELSSGYRTIFNLYTFEDLSHKEIGQLLGINEASSRSQLSRAKTILAKKVTDYLKINEQQKR